MPSEKGGGGTSGCSSLGAGPDRRRVGVGSLAGAVVEREGGERDEQQPGQGEARHRAQAWLSSTTRCISRSHMVWKNCSRWPTTALTFRATR